MICYHLPMINFVLIQQGYSAAAAAQTNSLVLVAA